MRRKVARVFFLIAALAAMLSLWAFLTGGFRIHVFGVPLSARGEHRAALLALASAVFGFFLHDRLQQKAADVAARVALTRLPLVLVIVAAASVLIAGFAFGSRAAGGSDAYGYVSQAELWRHGKLRIRQDFIASVPWPNAEWTFTPLGYKPAENNTIVPTYPPGLPLLMLLSSLVLGSLGPYVIGPIAGAALVVLTYALGLRFSSSTVGALAAVCVATSPTMLNFMLQPMSDVPVAAFWTGSLFLASRRTTSAAIGAAIAAGFALLIRPNLLPLAIVPLCLCAAERGGGTMWFSLGRAAAFAITWAPFPLAIAWLFNELYGSPLRSGYGENAGLFAWGHVVQNLMRYPRWLLQTQGPFVYVFLLTLLVPLRVAEGRLVRIALFTFTMLVFLIYLVYLPFDAWWFLRFLLPAYPGIFLLATDTVWLFAARFGSGTRILATASFGVLMAFYGAVSSSQARVFNVGRDEGRYIDVGRHAKDVLPPNAVVFTMQHLGTVRLYAGRLTVRFDSMDPEWLDRSVEYLRGAGYEPYFLLDEWEVPMFRERFRSQKAAALLAVDPSPAPCTRATFVYRIADGERWRVPRGLCD